MFADHKTTNRYLALFTFFVSLAIYILTLAPTASFWDAGEFIAVAHGLQVNHPPGAPFYSLLGRMASMFMPAQYVAVSINFLSALASAFTVMFLYLIVVRLVREFRGDPESYSMVDKIGMYGGGLVGSLTFAVTDTFWFNAVEAEVYALSMFFTAIVVWLALKWAENYDKDYNERWLVLIAYMFGLAIGVHLLNLLALFFVALIVYFKKRDFTLISFGTMGVAAVLSFFVVYPFTIQTLPDWADKIGAKSYGLIGPMTFIFLFIALIAGGIYYTQKHKHRLANIALISYAMIMIGYSSYSIIMIRSIANPPVDENDPETVEDFVKYLKREQYGDTPLLKGRNFDNATGQVNPNAEDLFPRRHSQDPNDLRFYSRYSSDWDFFWDYQVNHMYLRYFNWNFIGRVSDIQDTGWQSGFGEEKYPNNKASNAYYFIPFLLGVFGLIFHFTSDWRRALAVLVLFVVTGLAIIVFLNQDPYQPRERDYAYVGSFFAFAIWIGMGVTGLVDLFNSYVKDKPVGAYAIVGLCLLGSPILMGSENWDDHDRSLRYVAPDYAKNLLNSVAPNAILFTNGDNDTFPLWYAQEVEGVRTDVRIVCLSLLNTDWYIRQLKDQWSHESAPLPIDLSEEEIDQITSRIERWQPQTFTVPVNKPLLKQAFADEFNYKEAIGVKPDTSLPILQKGTSFEIPVDSLDNALTVQMDGRLYGQDAQGNNIYYMQVQDLMILELLKSNNWLRPIYFANTVSQSSMLGLEDYFYTEGKAYRIVPKKHDSRYTGKILTDVHSERLRRFSFTEWNNMDAYFDENIRRMLGNYRYSMLQLAETYEQMGQPDSAAYWLQFAEEKIPFRPDESSYNIPALFATKYIKLGVPEEAERLADSIIDRVLDEFNSAYSDFIVLQQEFDRLNADFEAARQRGDVRAQREIRPELQSVYESTQSLGDKVMQAKQYLSILQYGYFMSGNEEKAVSLASDVNEKLSGTPFPGMPETLEESTAEIRRYGLN